MAKASPSRGRRYVAARNNLVAPPWARSPGRVICAKGWRVAGDCGILNFIRREVFLLNYYQILEVPVSATDLEIESAYLRLSKAFSPENFSLENSFAKEQLALLDEAYRALHNPIVRKRYDAYLASLSLTGSFTPEHFSDCEKVPPPAEESTAPIAKKETPSISSAPMVPPPSSTVPVESPRPAETDLSSALSCTDLHTLPMESRIAQSPLPLKFFRFYLFIGIPISILFWIISLWNQISQYGLGTILSQSNAFAMTYLTLIPLIMAIALGLSIYLVAHRNKLSAKTYHVLFAIPLCALSLQLPAGFETSPLSSLLGALVAIALVYLPFTIYWYKRRYLFFSVPKEEFAQFGKNGWKFFLKFFALACLCATLMAGLAYKGFFSTSNQPVDPTQATYSIDIEETQHYNTNGGWCPEFDVQINGRSVSSGDCLTCSVNDMVTVSVEAVYPSSGYAETSVVLSEEDILYGGMVSLEIDSINTAGLGVALHDVIVYLTPQ